MKINLAKSAGFCFGVKRALEIAFGAAGSQAGVYMLGDIVHNEEVIKEIKKAGVKKIKGLASGSGKALLIRAHGEGLKIYQRAGALGYKIVDATCPMVKEIHQIAKEMENQGYKIIVIGDKKHDEVRGIIGQLKNKALIIDAKAKLPLGQLKKIKKAAVVCQSTQNFQKTQVIVDKLKKHIQQLKFFNTICRPTRAKQEEIKALPRENDVVIIIGSKTSANTQRLFEIAKSLNPRSYWVQSAHDLNKNWFKGINSVGITAGASTPDRTTQEVIKKIRAFA